jgi:NAD(P)-dependent dehydrogenase (short-subunit alcohol dehydrogenase family)
MARVCEGKVALVTGASTDSTGAAVAVRLAAEGAKVAITARSVDGLRDTLARVEAAGGEGLVLPADLSDPGGGRASLVEDTEAAFGPIDVLVNNAVAPTFKPVDQWSLADLEWHAQVNLFAPWCLIAEVMPGMRDRRRGWILNLTSITGELPPGPPFALKARDGSGMYGAMKAAINRLTIAAAGENEGAGIAVNALTPQVAIANVRTLDSGRVPDPDLYEPVETMAESALALCSGDPDLLTGRIAYSLQLLLELGRPVYDLLGEQLVHGWQPADLAAAIRVREAFHSGNGWPRAFDFHRPSTPRPAAIDGEPL